MNASSVFTSKQAIVSHRRVSHATRTHTQQRAHRSAKLQTFAFFNFNNNSTGTAQGPSRSDFDQQEVEDYFNYMGMLAAEGNYDDSRSYTAQD